MWRKGKKRGESGEADLGQAAKLAKTESDDSSGDIVVCELSKNRRVKVRNWQGKIVVDIREYYVKDLKELPGKKGFLITFYSKIAYGGSSHNLNIKIEPRPFILT
ncbi:hypothetical protein HPP92_005373 [Vanilla planifolia]|uniref:Transcriptional coactivator p15 (PC4) C-terminal domain-containing protein n=1 Tax=Vanilla planifolia TaxID=51239 RepID=A0A835VBA5_VANPL|nr:hypothetical protein HPP92_005373 [Vanilla planifolia]